MDFNNVAKKLQNEGPKSDPWTGRYQLLTSLWSYPLLDPSKSKVQTTSRQERCHTLHIPLAKINYFPYEEHTTVFLVPTDGKSASRKNNHDPKLITNVHCFLLDTMVGGTRNSSLA